MRAIAGVFLALVCLTACAQILGDDFEIRDDPGEGGAANGGATTQGGGGEGGGGNAAGGDDGGSGPGGAPACIEGFEGTVTQCYTAMDQALLLGAEAPDASLSVEIYYGFGSPPAPAAGTPFDFTFYGESYATCGVCARMADQCENGTCARNFIAVSGQIDVVSHGTAGGQFTGTLTDVVFAEATIDPNTFESTIVPNGATRCVPSFSFDATIAAQ